jgi:signal peptidase I
MRMDLPPDSRHAVRADLALEILRSFGKLRLAVAGSSMVPSIFCGDVLTVDRVNSKQIQTGHVVLYARGGRLFAHRVIRMDWTSGGVRWITRGDSLAREDLPVEESELLGRVTAVERNARQWSPVEVSGFARALQWAIRRSSQFLSLVLRWHSLCTRLTRKKSLAAVLSLSECR